MRNNTDLVKNLYYFAILTTVVVATWMASTLYYSLTSSTVPEDTSMYATPIAPTFDTQTMEQVSNRLSVPVDLSSTIEYTPLETEILESSLSADLDEAPIPTQNPEEPQ